MILTDINGLYDANPNENPEAKRFDYLPEITPELLGYAGSAGSKVGTGGMKSKLLANQIVSPQDFHLDWHHTVR